MDYLRGFGRDCGRRKNSLILVNMRYNFPMNFPTSFRLSYEAIRLIDDLSERLGLKRSAVIELAVRELAGKYKRGK